MRRRALLAVAAAGVLGGGYAARDAIAPPARITRRTVSGIATTPDGNRTTEDVLRELVVGTDPLEVVVYVREAFRDAFTTDRTNAVDAAVHDRLTDRFEGVRYVVQHTRGSGDTEAGRSEMSRLSRPSFNRATIAAEVRVVTGPDPWATVAWRTAPPEELTLRPHPEMDETE
jgi:hypothetical protein